MINENSVTEDDIEDVLPSEPEELAVPLELDRLHPWHRPRKQYIRNYQWLHFANMLIRKLINGGHLQHTQFNRPEIRYLTLPGIDYLDVRLLAECCDEHECILTSTGFFPAENDNPVKARAASRQSSLKNRGYISDSSHTIWKRIQDVIYEGKDTYALIQDRGPFHIVNIDACGSPTKAYDNPSIRMVEAMHRIVEIQLSRLSYQPWLLFLTVDVRRDVFESETLDNLTDAIRQNAEESPQFREDAKCLFSPTDGQALDLNEGIQIAKTSDGPEFIKLFSLGIAKWFLHLISGRQWTIKMHDSYFYSTTPSGDNRPTMPCLAFEFIPPPSNLPDIHKASRLTDETSQSTFDPSIHALKKVTEMVDLDRRIGADQSLRSSLICQTRKLLADAGYTEEALNQLETLDNGHQLLG